MLELLGAGARELVRVGARHEPVDDHQLQDVVEAQAPVAARRGVARSGRTRAGQGRGHNRALYTGRPGIARRRPVPCRTAPGPRYFLRGLAAADCAGWPGPLLAPGAAGRGVSMRARAGPANPRRGRGSAVPGTTRIDTEAGNAWMSTLTRLASRTRIAPSTRMVRPQQQCATGFAAFTSSTRSENGTGTWRPAEANVVSAKTTWAACGGRGVDELHPDLRVVGSGDALAIKNRPLQHLAGGLCTGGRRGLDRRARAERRRRARRRRLRRAIRSTGASWRRERCHGGTPKQARRIARGALHAPLRERCHGALRGPASVTPPSRAGAGPPVATRRRAAPAPGTLRAGRRRTTGRSPSTSTARR